MKIFVVGSINMDLRYIIAGVLFILASINICYMELFFVKFSVF